jgi:hypothetical protein
VIFFFEYHQGRRQIKYLDHRLYQVVAETFDSKIGIVLDQQSFIPAASVIGGFFTITAGVGFYEVTHFLHFTTTVMQVNRHAESRKEVNEHQCTEKIFFR